MGATGGTGQRHVQRWGCNPSKPPAYFSLLDRFDPLWNSIVVGGFHGGKPFLGTVGMIGTNYTDEHVATGKSSVVERTGHAGQLVAVIVDW